MSSSLLLPSELTRVKPVVASFSFPGADDETLLRKFTAQHRNNNFYAAPQMRDNSFFVLHYAGKVKYQITGFREKNLDSMRHDVMVVLKNSSLAFVRELVGE